MKKPGSKKIVVARIRKKSFLHIRETERR